MPPSKAMIERQFDDVAADYDAGGGRMFARFGARLVEQVPFGPDARVLDVATGRGAALLPAARRLAGGGTAVGVDLSAEMLSHTRRAAAAEGLHNVELARMDAERLDFPDASFAAVLCANGLFLFPDPAAALREMHRVTVPGGHVGVSAFGGEPPAFMPAWRVLVDQLRAYGVLRPVPDPLAFYTPEQLVLMLGQAGFARVEVVAESSDVVFASTDEWWEFLLTMAPRPALMSMDEATRARFKEEYALALGPFLGPGGSLCLPVSMVYAAARRY